MSLIIFYIINQTNITTINGYTANRISCIGPIIYGFHCVSVYNLKIFNLHYRIGVYCIHNILFNFLNALFGCKGSTFF